MYVNGHKLPEYLMHLMADGRWKRPTDTTKLEKITESQYAHSFEFLDIFGMRLESQFNHLMENDLLTIYGLASSTSLGNSVLDDSLLDIDNAVIIAINEIEEVIYLDYRKNSKNPRVMLSFWKTGNSMKSSVIAADFTSFASQLGL